MRPKISDNDYGTKSGHVRRFLEAGSKVRASIMFRGREMTHTELGLRLLDRLADDMSELGVGHLATAEHDGRADLGAVLEEAARDRVERPGANDVVSLRPNVARVQRLVASRIVRPSASSRAR
jgi:translation initiation factor IF-3